MEFKSGGKYPFTRLLTLVFVLVFLSGLIIVSGLDIIYLAAAVAAPLLVFGVSPLMTRHSIASGGLTLRQGWYFRSFIPSSNIAEMGLSEEYAPPRSISYSPRRRSLFIAPFGSPLVRIELREAVRIPFSSGRPVQTVVVGLDDPDGFLAEARRTMQVPVQDGTVCPHCRQPLPKKGMREKAPETPREDAQRIEHIFLIHHDGRLVFQFAGGRLQPLSTSSVSGMLVVIQDFIRDAFRTEGGALRTLEHGDLTVLIESGGITYLAVVVSGPDVPHDLRAGMKRVLRETEQEFGDVLREWDGDVPEGIGKVVSQVLWA